MNEKLLLSVFVAVEGAHAFSAFMPSYFTVKKFSETQEDLVSLRSGYLPASVFNLALGGVVSAVIKDFRPLVLSIAVIVFMVILYEQAISKKTDDITESVST